MATTSPDNLFSPDASDDYDLVVDWAASMTSVQNALTKRANSYKGTAAQRTAFTTATIGDLWQDTSGDRSLWVWTGVWTEHRRRNPRVNYQSSGANLANFTAVTAPPANSDILLKTGFWHGFTSVSFGNEYASTVDFDTAFPTACASVTFSQIHIEGAKSAVNSALDMRTKSSFRVVYPGGTAATERAFTWTAVGW